MHDILNKKCKSSGEVQEMKYPSCPNPVSCALSVNFDQWPLLVTGQPELRLACWEEKEAVVRGASELEEEGESVQMEQKGEDGEEVGPSALGVLKAVWHKESCETMPYMNRTFPDNVKFRKTADPCLQHALYNVLVAYGHHNKAVGYCQGMNFIAGYLILITKNEEESFWLLDALIGRILPDYYSPAMLGLKTDQEVLGELVKMKVPAVAELMERHGVMWTLVVSRWFICLFIDILPVETVLRIWDCLFYEGSKIIFRVALTLIKQHQAFILEATNFPDICEKFKQITKGTFVTECHSFMQKIFTDPGSLSMATINKLRETCREKLLSQG
ncbi:Growth hormone-regulated TBC protein 1 [Willisornis vidua]|uniref:Growth hormone-regulated TBC protein 1 n=1 Tax=Willisornis vidua TaxID=1566151 RepID=A0ABQ9D401_9PASS|nr:Growth hormone-regulated TBC protein 1 [Willisornis vidua]